MANPKPNYITMCNEGKFGDREFVVSCKGRPFAILTAPQFPTPAFTMVDLNLIRDLNLRMTDLQCTKLSYGGQKLRILGKVSTSVQCIVDGVPAGNMHLKAHVIQDLYKLFDTHSIAGTKLSQKLIGPPFQLFPDNSAEPTEENSDAPEAKKKRRKRKLNKSSPSQATVYGNSPTRSSTSESPSLPSKPQPKVQGRWIQHHRHGGPYGKPSEFVVDYEDRKTGMWQYERPDCWDSEGSFHSISSMKSCLYSSSSNPDEYTDTYTNLSSVRYNKPVQAGSELPKTSANLVKDNSTTYSRRMLAIVHEAWKESLNTGKDIPPHLQHIPVPHGIEWCSRDCAAHMYSGEELPPLCGYSPEMLPEDFFPCSNCCPGRWCSCCRKYTGRDFVS